MRTMDAVIFQDIGKWGFEKRPVSWRWRPAASAARTSTS